MLAISVIIHSFLLLLLHCISGPLSPGADVSEQVVLFGEADAQDGFGVPLPLKDSWITHPLPQPPSSLTVALVSPPKSVSILAPQVPWLPACGPHLLDAVAMATAFKSLRPPSEVTGLDGDWLIQCLLHSQACLDGRQEKGM